MTGSHVTGSHVTRSDVTHPRWRPEVWRHTPHTPPNDGPGSWFKRSARKSYHQESCDRKWCHARDRKSRDRKSRDRKWCHKSNMATGCDVTCRHRILYQHATLVPDLRGQQGSHITRSHMTGTDVVHVTESHVTGSDVVHLHRTLHQKAALVSSLSHWKNVWILGSKTEKQSLFNSNYWHHISLWRQTFQMTSDIPNDVITPSADVIHIFSIIAGDGHVVTYH